MEKLKAQHAAAVAKQEALRADAKRLQGMRADSKAERARLDGEIEEPLVRQALASERINTDHLLWRRPQLNAEIAALPEAIGLAQQRAELTPQELENVAPISQVGGTGAHRKGEAPQDSRWIV
jgi:hypothetical protein